MQYTVFQRERFGKLHTFFQLLLTDFHGHYSVLLSNFAAHIPYIYIYEHISDLTWEEIYPTFYRTFTLYK